MEKVMLILMMFAMGAAVLALGIGFEKLVRWGEREGIVKRGYVREDTGRGVEGATPYRKREFHEGDRVEVIYKVDGLYLGGMQGTVVAVESASPYPIGVEFDEPIYEGHSCFGRGQNGCCRFGKAEDFREVP